MSTGSLLRWIALVAGGELAVRGYAAGRVALCHAGAALFALALAALLARTRARRAGFAVGAALLALTAVDAALALRATGRSSEATASVGPFDCEQRVVAVEAGTALEGDLSGQLVLVRAPATSRAERRASPLGRALEEWLNPPTADVARYREAVLAARRASADVALLVPQGDGAPLARSVRALAGSYAIRAVEPGPELESLLADRRCR